MICQRSAIAIYEESTWILSVLPHRLTLILLKEEATSSGSSLRERSLERLRDSVAACKLSLERFLVGLVAKKRRKRAEKHTSASLA